MRRMLQLTQVGRNLGQNDSHYCLELAHEYGTISNEMSWRP